MPRIHPLRRRPDGTGTLISLTGSSVSATGPGPSPADVMRVADHQTAARGEEAIELSSRLPFPSAALARRARRRGRHHASAGARDSLSDQRLVALLRQGDSGAFDVLAARYQTRLLRFCWQILRSKEDAEDALQEVFTAAFNALLMDEREIAVRPWLYRIARNRCINQLRRAAAVGCDTMDDRPSEVGGTVVERLVRRQQFRELVADVQTLPDTQRTALLLREMDGFSYLQIAHALETSVPGVKSLLVRARAGLLETAAARERTSPAAGPNQSGRAKPARSSATARRTGYRAARAAASAAA